MWWNIDLEIVIGFQSDELQLSKTIEGRILPMVQSLYYISDFWEIFFMIAQTPNSLYFYELI